MHDGLRRGAALLAVLLAALATPWTVPPTEAQTNKVEFTGFVYYDLNGNGRWDPGEPTAANAQISVGFFNSYISASTAVSDAKGNYTVSVMPDAPAYPFAIIARGINVVGDALGNPTVVAQSSILEYIPPQPTVTLDIGLRFVGNSKSPTQFEAARDCCTTFLGNYFDHRGGIATLGYPISRLFLLAGLPTQIFQRAVLQQWPDGSVHLLNLLDPGFLPFTSFNGSIVPAYDPSLVADAPSPGSANYADGVLGFLFANVPDVVNGQPVRLLTTYLNTVSLASAFPALPPPSFCQHNGIPMSRCTSPPGYGDSHLLAGFDLEIWGLPTSHPLVDPSNHTFIYQRFQRGILQYQASTGVTEGILLGQYFKEVLMGQGMPADVAAEVAGSPDLGQYCPSEPHWICRPQVLNPAATDLTGAFEPEVAVQ